MGLRCAVEVVKDDESLYMGAFTEQLSEVSGPGGPLFQVVSIDQSAKGYAGVVVESIDGRFEHRAAGVLEDAVDSIRGGLDQLFCPVLRLTVDDVICAEIVEKHAALFGSAGDADDAGACMLGQLYCDAADSTGGSRDQDRLSGLRFEYVAYTCPGGKPRHAKDSEPALQRYARILRDTFPLRSGSVDHESFLPADKSTHEISWREFSVACGYHTGDSQRSYRGADLDRR
ncbi:hypothetical protein TL10_03460 [Mycolicibacterium llatzerense]|uniref:Uncharacterized protein n=1 Tax=Mycolicibacterium llatzerense TaxID=280871 RepID=A0A0D1LJ22_9MYCO|nr:hypothetical protein TL10_03460 [Mycolicibacterium llatzerense]